MPGRLHMDAGTRGRHTEYGQGIGSVLDTAWVRKCQALEAPAVLSRLYFYLCQRGDQSEKSNSDSKLIYDHAKRSA